MNLLYPLDVDRYQIFINNNPVDNVKKFDEDFITDPILFTDKESNVSLTLYKNIYNEVTKTYDNIEVIKLNVIPTYSNSNITCGILSAYEV